MAFHEVRFPARISLGATGGPERRTEIVVLGSGAEERNSRWADSKRSWNAGYGIKRADDLHAVIAFFEERRGRFHGFRFKDWSDYKSCAPEGTASALDQERGAAIMDLLARLTHAEGTATLLVTHDLVHSPTLDEIVTVVDGRIASGSPVTA